MQRTVSWMRSATRARVACQRKGEAEDQHHRSRWLDRVIVSASGRRSPAGKRARRAPPGEDTERIAQRPHRGHAGGAVRQRNLQRTGGGAERRQRLRGSEHVEDLPASFSGSFGTLPTIAPSEVGNNDRHRRRGPGPAARAPARAAEFAFHVLLTPGWSRPMASSSASASMTCRASPRTCPAVRAPAPRRR